MAPLVSYTVAPMTLVATVPLLLLLLPHLTIGQSVFGQQSVFDQFNQRQNPQQVNNVNNLVSPNVNPFQQFLPQQQQLPNVNGFSGFNRPNLAYMSWEQLEEYEKYADLREAEDWWHLYPFGKRYHDGAILEKPYQDLQIDLDFDYPFYGFRFNYTYIYPQGLIAFSVPEFVQPPITFPNPQWPNRRDASLIAAFYTDAQFQHVADRGISHVWYRTVHRPYEHTAAGEGGWTEQTRRVYSAEEIWEKNKNAYGRVIDPWLLDNITHDIQEGIIGANGFQCDYALIITWERMAYGGAPKVTEVDRFNEVKKWQNTYQLILATDEIRSYVILNYAHINWTSSTSAGTFAGRGGKQSALVGFNAGNGTGWTPLPYSGEGRVNRLAEFSNVMIPGRWIYRVDEQIITGGCSNESVGWMFTSPIAASMLGGVTVNVSGPCLRTNDIVKVIFDEYLVDCIRINSIRAQCILPVDKLYKTGLVNTKMSRDSGQSFPYVGVFYILQPDRAGPQVKLIDNPNYPMNNWKSPNSSDLWMEWAPLNLTSDFNARVDITLWGYWEDTDNHIFEQVGVLSRGYTNNGRYNFNPRIMPRTDMKHDSWKLFHCGVVQIRITDRQHQGVFWSKVTPLSWYFYDIWNEQYGRHWALEKCVEWFNYDGQRLNFVMDLEPNVPCPCVLDQALLDIGRFAPIYGCDRDGDAGCEYNKGSQHCVLAVAASWTGAGQVCCYDFEGWLMHSDDYENAAYLKYNSPGVPQRGHPWGSYPFKRPPYVPSLSNWATDLMAYEFCCRYAGNCEFYYWRRQTSGCQEYRPPTAGFIYGEPHIVTYDGARYSFQGKGYYVLSMMKSPFHDFMVQVRLEQPLKTTWNAYPNATVVTGVAIQENDSDVVQILARKEFRRWRYHMDVMVNGIERFFDTPEFKLQQFRGVTIRSPERNMNQSEIHVMFDSGAGIRVQEAYGMLSVMVILPPHFNESAVQWKLGETWGHGYQTHQPAIFTGDARRHGRYVSLGLLGTFNGDIRDELMTPDGAQVNVAYPPTDVDSRTAFYNFGELWRVERSRTKLLFQENLRPINDPMLFASKNYIPVFDPHYAYPRDQPLYSFEEIRVTCQGVYECEYDFLLTGMREIGLSTLDALYRMELLRDKGSKLQISCGALQKAEGAIKHPPGNNYLSGVTVTFSCKPEFFLHGSQQRTCHNGTWSEGWWVWCRGRTEEYALKWLTGILVSLLVIGLCAFIYVLCWIRRKTLNKAGNYPAEPRRKAEPTVVKIKTAEAAKQQRRSPPTLALREGPEIPQMESEPKPAVHLHSRSKNGFSESSA